MLIVLKDAVINWHHIVDFTWGVVHDGTKDIHVVYLRTTKDKYKIKEFDSKSSAESFIVNNIPRIFAESEGKSIVDLRKI